jgi:hydrogenase nickel incorporation protein HypA/HybF
MHEVAQMQGMVTEIVACAKAAQAQRITRVALCLGTSGHMTEAVARQHFDILATGTLAEGAKVDIVWLPATYQCFTCGQQFSVMDPQESLLCPSCGEIALEIGHADVCYAESIEVETALPKTGTAPSPIGGFCSGRGSKPPRRRTARDSSPRGLTS